LEALDEHVTISALSERYGISPSLISEWKRSLEERAHRIFKGSHHEKDERDREMEALTKKRDALIADREFLKNKLSAYLQGAHGIRIDKE
jgi:transposase-like protein